MSKPVFFTDIRPVLSSNTLKVIENLNFKYMTPVQATSIPLFLQNKDVCVEATTGSGKTLSFTIPIFEKLSSLTFNKTDVGALILAPTRELAEQIYDLCLKFYEQFPSLKPVLFVGGSSVQENIENFFLYGGQIIVGTPGRVLDIINRNSNTSINEINFKKLEMLILDEADKLLDMGFKDSINQILKVLPKQRRTGLFSATQTKEVSELARAGLRNPINISVKVQNNNKKNNQNELSQATPNSLNNYYIIREFDYRPYELIRLINENKTKKMIVFLATCACVDFFSEVFYEIAKEGKLLPKNFKIVGFHGKMNPKKRNIIYNSFKNDLKNKKSNDNNNNEEEDLGSLMFTTDVTARGIDIPNIDLIIQYCAPKDPSFFVHRVGRTARAGRSGNSIIFLSPEEQPYIEFLKGRGVPLINGEETFGLINKKEESDPNHEGSGSENSQIKFLKDWIKINTKDTSNDFKVKNYFNNDEDSEYEEDNNNKLNDDEKLKLKLSTFNIYKNQLINNEIIYFNRYLKNYNKSNRSLLELSSTGFMSFIKFYKEHLLTFIFRLEELDIGALARSYGLLRLPKIAETRGIKGKKIIFYTDKLDTSKISYKNKEQEKARVIRLAKSIEKEKEEQEAKLNNKNNKNNKNDKPTTWLPKEEYEKIEKKRERKKKLGYKAKFMEEWDEYSAEEMAYKKFKKGKISKDEYESILFNEGVKEKVNKIVENDHHKNDYIDDSDFSDSDMSD